jgi:hypothetical protein
LDVPVAIDFVVPADPAPSAVIFDELSLEEEQ